MVVAKKSLRSRGLASAIRSLAALGALVFWHDANVAHAQGPNEDPATSRVVALVERLGGELQWDENTQGRPLVGVRLGSTRIKDEQLGDLAALPTLRHLELFLTRITDAGLAHFRGHQGLRHLNLYHTRITDAGFEHLAAIPNLEELILGPCEMTEKGLARLQSARHLRTLKIYEIDLTDPMLATVGRLGQIEQLDFYDVGLTDARLAHLRGLRDLRRLSLDNNLITDDGLVQLSGFTQLESLGLEGTKVTDAGLVHLKNLSRLRMLRHTDSPITDAGLKLLPQIDRGPDAPVLVGSPGPRPAPRDRAAVAVKDVSSAQIREAVRRAVGPLQATLTVYSQKRDCYACHHQGVPLFALANARSRGVPIDEEVFDGAVAHTRTDLEGALDRYRQGRGQAGGATQAGYALWTLEAVGQTGDNVTSTVAKYLVSIDRDLGHWKPLSRRPPMEASRVTATALALRALTTYEILEPGGATAARVAQALDWLRKTPPADTEDRVFRLWGLKYAGATPEEIQAAARDLLATQRPDGGWAQTDELDSDAYATGSALVGLNETGHLPTDDPAYRRGAAFLVATQEDDGTWHVVTRSEPVQVYFDSGFPHGKDQFISAAATGWAATALSLALPPK